MAANLGARLGAKSAANGVSLRIDRSLLPAGERVCVAVSGGADSVALLLAFGEANAEKGSLGIVLSAVHVQHGLRGEEAAADEQFVRELCGRLAVPLAVFRVDTPARQAEEREGIEEAARNLRYEVFRGLLESGKADAVTTAHTLDDQAETVLMKLLRGAWTEGLGGISPVVEAQGSGIRDQGSGIRDQGGKGRMVRPMLGVRRAEVEAFLRGREQPWREDSSNRDLALTRNRVRHELMPMLRSFNPGIDIALARLSEVARDEEAFWAGEVARLLPALLLPGKPVRGGGRAVGTGVGGAACALELERLRPLAPALQRRVIRAAARTLGSRLSADDTARLLVLAGLANDAGSRAKAGSRLDLPRGFRAERSARELRFWRQPEAR